LLHHPSFRFRKIRAPHMLDRPLPLFNRQQRPVTSNLA
jgi:hypothetical protein